MSEPPTTSAPTALPFGKLAAAPISWGVCEVPGWGRMLPADRVFSEMSALGIGATELGPVGYLPMELEALQATLGAHGLSLVGGFVPLVLHEDDASASLELARTMATLMGAAGADVFVAALLIDAEWGPPRDLTPQEWANVARHLVEVEAIADAAGLTVALHPHVGTVLETATQIAAGLEATTTGWCMDSGHLFLGGVDPADFVRQHADRIVHVHLKDVDAAIGEQVMDGSLTLLQAVQAGLFRPLGTGDVGMAQVLSELHGSGYERWLVLEQDTAITGEEPPVGGGPALDVSHSITYLMSAGALTRKIPS